MVKFKLNIQKINIYFSVLTTIATIVAIIAVSSFLYKNFYQTITQSEEILILRQKVAPLTVDMDKFNKIMAKIEKKKKIRELGAINDPFSYGGQNKRISNMKSGDEAEGALSGQGGNGLTIPQFQ